MQRIRFILNERGGLIGTVYMNRSFLANGSAMVVMQYAQRKVTEWGLRDWDVSMFAISLSFVVVAKTYFFGDNGGV